MARIDNLDHFLTDVADAIRTKTGSQATIQASSFDTAIEAIPSGSDGIYLVESIEERDELTNISNGDICVVYGMQDENLPEEGFTTNLLKFPETVVFDEPINDWYSAYFVGENNHYNSLDIMLENNNARISFYSESDYFDIEYNSTDGMTYTLNGNNSVEIPYDTYNVGSYDEKCAQFVLVNVINFSGMFQYSSEDESWEYLNINMHANEDEIFTGNSAYTSEGKVVGNQNRKDYRKINIYSGIESPNFIPEIDKSLYIKYINEYDVGNEKERNILINSKCSNNYNQKTILNNNTYRFVTTRSLYYNGYIYILDSYAKNLYKFNPLDNTNTIILSNMDIANDNPTNIIEKDNNLYFTIRADDNIHYLYIVNLSNNTYQRIQTPFTYYPTLAMFSTGDDIFLYSVYSNNQMYKINNNQLDLITDLPNNFYYGLTFFKTINKNKILASKTENEVAIIYKIDIYNKTKVEMTRFNTYNGNSFKSFGNNNILFTGVNNYCINNLLYTDLNETFTYQGTLMQKYSDRPFSSIVDGCPDNILYTYYNNFNTQKQEYYKIENLDFNFYLDINFNYSNPIIIHTGGNIICNLFEKMQIDIDTIDCYEQIDSLYIYQDNQWIQLN